MYNFKFFCVVVVMSFSCIVIGQRRQCGNTGVQDIQVTNLNQAFSATLNDTADDVSVTVKLTLTWDVLNPGGDPFDGFLVQLIEPLIFMEALEPLNTCISGNAALWISQSSCPNGVPGVCPGIANFNGSVSCLCPINNCTEEVGLVNCRGSAYFLTDTPNNIAIQSDVRKLEFVVKFHTTYQILFRPYYRQYVQQSFPYALQRASDCHSLIAESENLTQSQAIALCCELGVPHFDPLEFTVSQLQPNFTSGRVELTLSWMPPVYQGEDLTFDVRVLPREALLESQRPVKGSTERVPPTEVFAGLNVSCYNSTFGYRAVISNLLINSTYAFQVKSSYSGATRSRHCLPRNSCSKSITRNFTETNFCDDSLNPCGERHDCIREAGGYSCRERCPELLFSHYNPLQVTLSDVKPNFTTGNAEVTLMWMPPVFRQDGLYYDVSVSPPNGASLSQNPVQGAVTRTAVTSVAEILRVSCYNSSYGFQVAVSNLLITSDYNFDIKSRFLPSTQNRYCAADDQCSGTLSLQLTQLNLCDDLYNPCAEGYQCNRQTVAGGGSSYSCNTAASNLKPLTVMSALSIQFVLFLLLSQIF